MNTYVLSNAKKRSNYQVGLKYTNKQPLFKKLVGFINNKHMFVELLKKLENYLLILGLTFTLFNIISLVYLENIILFIVKQYIFTFLCILQYSTAKTSFYVLSRLDKNKKNIFINIVKIFFVLSATIDSYDINNMFVVCVLFQHSCFILFLHCFQTSNAKLIGLIKPKNKTISRCVEKRKPSYPTFQKRSIGGLRKIFFSLNPAQSAKIIVGGAVATAGVIEGGSRLIHEDGYVGPVVRKFQVFQKGFTSENKEIMRRARYAIKIRRVATASQLCFKDSEDINQEALDKCFKEKNLEKDYLKLYPPNPWKIEHSHHFDVKKSADSAVDAVGSAIGAVGSGVAQVGRGVRSGVSHVGQRVMTGVRTIGSGISTGVSNGTQGMVDFLKRKGWWKSDK